MLKTSVVEKIFTLPPDTQILSGHGPETSVSDEQSHDSFFAEFYMAEPVNLAIRDKC